MSLKCPGDSKGLYCSNCGSVTQVWIAGQRGEELGGGRSYAFLALSVAHCSCFPTTQRQDMTSSHTTQRISTVNFLKALFQHLLRSVFSAPVTMVTCTPIIARKCCNLPLIPWSGQLGPKNTSPYPHPIMRGPCLSLISLQLCRFQEGPGRRLSQ